MVHQKHNEATPYVVKSNTCQNLVLFWGSQKKKIKKINFKTHSLRVNEVFSWYHLVFSLSGSNC